MKLKFGPYSPSRLDTASCPYSFYKQYIDPHRSPKHPENLPQARGAAVHEVFEVLTRGFADFKFDFSHQEIRDLVAKAVNNHPVAYQEASAIEGMAYNYLRKPPRPLVSDAEVEFRMAVKMTDEGFEDCSYDDPDAFARGRADIMMISDDLTEALVYDHKTQPNIEEADTFQLGFYAWVIAKTHPSLKRIKTILHFARYGYYSEPYVWTEEDLAAIENEILTRIQIIETKETWEAISHKNCQYCPFAKECPLLMELMEFDDAGNLSTKKHLTLHRGGEHQAPKFAGYINLLEELLKGLKDDLKAHVAMNGPVAIPGKVYDFSATEGVDWDKVNKALKNKAYDVFEKYDIDPKMFMGFSQTFSKSIWMAENESLVKELGELFPRKVSTEFRGRKM